MKYVDWVNSEYAHGDYSMIEAYVVAADFPFDVVEKKKADCVRNYTKGYRPTSTQKWDNCSLVKYMYIDGKLKFENAE